jgi:serine/threonine protein kinase
MDKYVKLAKIGQGSFGSAFVVTKKADPSGKKYVIKEIRVDPRDQQSALREAKLLSALDHPNIIACKESFFLPPLAPAVVGGLPGRGAVRREQVLCIVTEFADGGDLRKSMQQRQGKTPRFFQEHEVLDLFVQVCLALKHLHDRKIIHRDIKPENIFLSGANVVKLGDFGVATVLSHTLASAETLTGTPYYTSPEICLGKRYNSKTDVWSLGCVLYELATFAHPFDGRSQRQLFDNIIRASYTPVTTVLAGRQTQYSAGLGSLVAAMLMKNPRDRPSVGSLLKTPLVMARIQRFLSERAIADELNHTVLHGHDIFRKNAAPSHVQASIPAAVVKAKAPLLSPPPAPIAAARRAMVAPVRVSSAPKKDNNANKVLPSPAVRARLKNVGLRRSRSFKKRAIPVGSNAAASPFRSPIVAKKAVLRPNVVRDKAQAAVAASPKQIKAVAGSRDPPKRSMHGSKDASNLPEPPPAFAVVSKPPRGAVANRVAQFNAQVWMALAGHSTTAIHSLTSSQVAGAAPRADEPHCRSASTAVACRQAATEGRQGVPQTGGDPGAGPLRRIERQVAAAAS